MRALGVAAAAISVGCGLSPSEANGWAAARALAGTYVLRSINGGSATGPPSPLAACPQPGSLGELSLSGPAADAGPLYALEIRTAPAAAPTVRDAGDWSVRDELVRFASSPAYRRGAYTGEAHRDVGGGVQVTVTFGGDHLAFQRVRLWNDVQAWGLIRVTSVDTAGALAPGLVIRFRAPDGIESQGVVAYEQGAAQPERLCLAVHVGAEASLHVVLEPLAP